ncbi:MAG: hypothetical protein D3918_04165 [Candidatus Electrothrix sp. AX2]|nr:hypothetical protein [Candidatus Electrothrix gigas]
MKDVEFSNNGEEGTDCPTILPEQFIVTKKELDPAVYEQFLAMLEQGFPAINYEELVQQGKQLVDNNLSIVQKKLALAQLAQWGSTEAYRMVQAYAVRPDPGLEEWTRIALYACRMCMESNLLDEPVGLISTGLGGDGQRLRYIFVLALQGECPLAEEQQQEIRKTLDSVCRKHCSLVEEAQFRPSCLYVQVLMPLDVAIGEVIEDSITRLNQGDARVRQEYLATNVAVPTEKEIQAFLGG